MTLTLVENMKCRRCWACLAVAVLLGAVAWHASLPRAVGPAGGVAIEGVPSQATVRRTLRVGTFNIHGCKGEDGRRDPGRVAECLKDLDLVALQEVHGPWPWETLDQAHELSTRLGLAWLFAPNTRTWYCRDTGNGLLCARPPDFWQRIPLAGHGGRGFRNAVLLGLSQGDRTVRVLLTHISRNNELERTEQLRTVISLYLSLSEPAILLGDLNTKADDPQIHRLLAMPGVTDAVGKILGKRDSPRIDWIIARGMRCLDAGVRDNGASDHPALWAELE